MHGWMMGDWATWGPGYGFVGMIVMMFFWVLIIVGIVLIVRWLFTRGAQKPSSTDETALEILKRRYARGEINKEEFEAMKRDLT